MNTVILLLAALVVVTMIVHHTKTADARPHHRKHSCPLQNKLEELGDMSGRYKRDIINKLGRPLSKFTTPDCSILRWKDESIEISIRFDQRGKYQELIRMK